ncbi:MAG: phage virion morphogenesis protein [Gammaproteobacteria bacterium]|nr:phage virion morphogenesis protein [Gammaproteobacteria bacterium]
MSGIRIGMDWVNDEKVLAVFQRTVDVMEKPEIALKQVGEYLQRVTRERFDAQAGPDGKDWQELSEKYKARKVKNQHLVLIWEQDMMSTVYQVNGDALEFGSDTDYGRTHNLGDESRGIPARPWLGLNDEDKQEVLAIFQDEIDGVWDSVV